MPCNHWSWNTSIVIWSNFLVSVTHTAIVQQKSEHKKLRVRFWQGKKLHQQDIFIFYLWFGNEVDARTDVQLEAVNRKTLFPPDIYNIAREELLEEGEEWDWGKVCQRWIHLEDLRGCQVPNLEKFGLVRVCCWAAILDAAPPTKSNQSR